MGWFWADPPQSNSSVSQHSLNSTRATPPPGCPVHENDRSTSPLSTRTDSPSNRPSACPVKSSNHPLRSLSSNKPASSDLAAESQSTTSVSSTLSKLNPLNYIPSGLANSRPKDSPQTISLPLERETSSIPRGDNDANWEYPSPQQMYNAMLRKGYTDTPADAVESMVAVHNFLNEGAWDEIVEWENIFSRGLVNGWEVCKKGERGIAFERAKREYLSERKRSLGIEDSSSEEVKPKLIRFMGRPGEPTPKARILSALGYVFPERFGNEPPFDRHDWYVARKNADGSTKQVRYVIDYYSGGVQATGEPVFYLDIRPALDTPTAAVERAMRWGGDVWYRATGAEVRESQKGK